MTIFYSDFSANLISHTLSWVSSRFGWYYLLAATLYIVFVVFIACGTFRGLHVLRHRFGNGKEHQVDAYPGVYIVFVVFIACSRFGSIKLGPEQSKPEFSVLSWAAMLFAAGIGIELMFFSVAEPVTQYTPPQYPPYGQSGH